MYAYITFAQSKAQLAEILGDPANVFWKDGELGIYIKEALRTWGSMSLYWRDRGAFTTSSGNPWYVLPTVLPSLLGYTVTDLDLVREMEYQLLEPATGATWTGTPMFSVQDLVNALQRRRNQFRVEVGMCTQHSQSFLGPPADGRFALSDSVIDVRRLAWQTLGDTAWQTLWREDEWAFGAASAMTWPQNPGTPQSYSIATEPPLSVQLNPYPSANGTVDLLTVNAGADLDPTIPTLLGIPDDFAWVVKFGALADKLGEDGPARDPLRSEYCESRWDEGIQLAKIYTSIMQLRVNDMPIYTTSVQEFDSGNYAWQSQSGRPNVGALSGFNVLALAGDGATGFGVPDAAYGISADVVRRAIVPVADGDFLQIGREQLDSILRYAEHLAAFKMGGEEFAATKTQYQGMLKAALVYNERLRANIKNFAALTDRRQLEAERRPRRTEQVPA